MTDKNPDSEEEIVGLPCGYDQGAIFMNFDCHCFSRLTLLLVINSNTVINRLLLTALFSIYFDNILYISKGVLMRVTTFFH